MYGVTEAPTRVACVYKGMSCIYGGKAQRLPMGLTPKTLMDTCTPWGAIKLLLRLSTHGV
jgi:hypothetical protein